MGDRLGGGQHGAVHGGHALEDRHLVSLDDLQRLAGVEPGQQGQRAPARHRGIQPAGQPEDVEQRQAAHRHVVDRVAQQGPRGEGGVAGQPGVGKLRALRPARGTGGIQDDGVILAGRIGPQADRGQAGQVGTEVGIVDPDDLRPGIGRALGRLAGSRMPGEYHPGARVTEVVGHLPALEQRVHRHHHGPGGHRAVERDGEGGHVRQHQPDPVSRLDPERRQQGRRPPGRVAELRVAQHEVIHADGRPVRMGSRCPLEHGAEVRHDILP